MVESDGGYDAENDDACDASLDDYELGDNNGLKLDMSSDDEVQATCNIYKANSGAFEFSTDGENNVQECG